MCGGTGAKPGTLPECAPRATASGAVAVDQGPFSFSQVCPTCGGRGSVVKDKCKHCKGRGIEVRPRTVKVRIPAGVDDGQRIRVKGRGTPGLNGGPARRPLRGRARRAAPDLRPERQVRPHGEGADHVPRGRARRAGEGAHARRAGHGEGPAGHPDAARRSASAGRGIHAGVGRSRRAARDLRRHRPVGARRRRAQAAVEELAAALPGNPREHLGV